MQDILLQAFQKLLQQHCKPKCVREIEGGASADPLWQAIDESGFADAMTPESHGGSGLGLRDVFATIAASGAYALPVPLAHTMVSRAVLSDRGISPPSGSITFTSCAPRATDDPIDCACVPYGRVSQWVIVDLGDTAVLLNTNDAARTATGVYGSLEANARWPGLPSRAVYIPASVDWRAAGAAISAAHMAGAIDRLLTSSVEFVQTRTQFGRPLGKFQAIQQQLSVLAEERYACHMAAQIGCDSSTYVPNRALAAVAKSVVSESANKVALIAHAVHGAIGITEELDLQLFTRRLHEWRLAYGTESYWNREIGQRLIASRLPACVDFIRDDLLLLTRCNCSELTRHI